MTDENYCDWRQSNCPWVKDLRARIAELEMQVAFIKPVELAQNARIAELEAENAKLRTALKPFAEMTRYCYDKGDDEQLCVVVSDLRAACEAMERKND